MTPACPDENGLLDLLAKRLPEAEADAIREHLDSCESCRAAVVEGARALPTGAFDVATSGGNVAPQENGEAEVVCAGTLVGRYRVEKLLGTGGMGVVYLAEDSSLGRRVALKLLRPGQVRDTDALEQRLVRESRAMAKLAHPNVLSVFDIGTFHDRVFVAMEFVDGPTLRQWLRDEKPNWMEVLARFRQAGAGLAAAHAAGFVHRDFKPDNVLLDSRGRVLVTDFGLVRSLDAADARDSKAVGSTAADDSDASHRNDAQGPSTRSGAILGTPAYMAPEQFAGSGVDARADVFSFCVALWEALYGTRPFGGATAAEIHEAVRRGVPPVPETGRGAPSFVERAVRRGLEADPARRHASMEALLVALRPRPRRWKVAVAVGAAVVIAGVATTIATPDAPVACTGFAADLDGVWDEPTRGALSRRVLEEGADDGHVALARVLTQMNAQASAWTQARRDMCAAAERTRAVVPPARLECLDQRRQELSAAVRLLQRAPPRDIAATLARLRFLPPESCANRNERALKSPLPEDPVLAEKVSAVRAELTRARTELNEGHGARAVQRVHEALERARALKFEPLLAEALYLRGRIEMDVGEAAASRRTLLEAANVAEAAHHDDQAAASWVALLSLSTTDLRETDTARNDTARARAAIARLGGDLELEARVTYHEGLARLEQGRYDDAEQLILESVALAEQMIPEESFDLREGLAMVFDARGEHRRAIETHLQVLDARARLRGPDHRDVALSHTNVASIQIHLGRFDEAVAHLQESRRIVEAAYGTDHLEYATHLNNLAEMLRTAGRHEEALEQITRAIAIVEKRMGRRSVLLGLCLETQAGVFLGMKRYPEAATKLREALAINSLLHGDQHPTTARTRINLGEALLKTGQPAEAVDQQRQGVAVFTTTAGEKHLYTQYARLELAKTLRAVGDRASERDVLQAAVDAFSTIEADPAMVAAALFQLAQVTGRDPGPGARSKALQHARRAIQLWEQQPDAAGPDLLAARAWLRKRERTRENRAAPARP